MRPGSLQLLGMLSFLVFHGCVDDRSDPSGLQPDMSIVQPNKVLMLQSESRSHSFSFEFLLVNHSLKSTGIVLKSVSCGCTSILCDGHNLAVGDSMLLPAGCRKAFSVSAEVSRPESRSLSATFISPGLSAPLKLDWNIRLFSDLVVADRIIRITEDQTTATFKIVVNHRADVNGLLKVSGCPPCITYNSRLTKSEQLINELTRDEYEGTLKWLSADDISKNLLLSVDLWGDGKLPVASVPIRILRTATEVIEFPQTVNIGPVAVGSRRSTMFLVRSTCGTPFRITGNDLELLSGEVTYQDDIAPSHIVKCAIEAAATGPLQGRIRLRTDSSRQREIVIDVEGLGVDKTGHQVK